MNTVQAFNIKVLGNPDGPPMLFAHGFGCEQAMWRFVTPAFEATHKIVLYDLMGLGGSDLTRYDASRYASLDGHADDVLTIIRDLDLQGVVFVGHSVSSMIGVLAAGREPERFASLVLVSPSPRYIDDEGYTGGFDREDIDELLETLASNHLGWSAAMGPVIMGNADRPELAEELTETFCQADPEIAHQFAKATFLADNRADLPKVQPPCLVLQCSHDVIAPEAVGRYVAAKIPNAELAVLEATGHCPNLSAPAETAAAIQAFL